MTKKKEHPIEVVLENENVLPEAPASVNMRIDWNGADLQLTLRDFDENDLLARLVQIKPALEELGMTLKNGAPKGHKGQPTKSQAKGTPEKAEPEGIVDEVTIDITSIYINSGRRGNYCYVKGTPGFEEDGAICYEDAWQGSGYNLQDQEPKKFYDPADFGFVRAVIRLGDKPRVWKLLTSHEVPAF